MILPIPGISQDKDSHVFFRNEFPSIWERARAYTFEVVEIMPEEFYDFSPTEDQLTFREHFIHIAGNLYRLTGYVVLENETIDQHVNYDVKSKKELISLLNEAFDFVEKTMSNINDDLLSEEISFSGKEMTKERIFYLMRDHCTHHRAVAISYLRMKDIQPPRYRGW